MFPFQNGQDVLNWKFIHVSFSNGSSAPFLGCVEVVFRARKNLLNCHPDTGPVRPERGGAVPRGVLRVQAAGGGLRPPLPRRQVIIIIFNDILHDDGDDDTVMTSTSPSSSSTASWWTAARSRASSRTTTSGTSSARSPTAAPPSSPAGSRPYRWGHGTCGVKHSPCGKRIQSPHVATFSGLGFNSIFCILGHFLGAISGTFPVLFFESH